MGLCVCSLEDIPSYVERDYYIYLLDYGWQESLSEALLNNFYKMAEHTSKNNAVVIRGEAHHFEDDVFSWHHINGEDAEEILPAILITNRHPAMFRDYYRLQENANNSMVDVNDLKLILIPLKKFCATTTEVVTLINKLLKNIKEQKDLEDFEIAKEMKKGEKKALYDAVILKPSFFGVGIDLNSLIKSFLK